MTTREECAMPHVRLRGQLRAMAGGAAEHRVPGTTVGELLVELERGVPALRGWILDERGLLRRHINVFVDGERATQETPLDSDERRVDVLPAITGG